MLVQAASMGTHPAANNRSPSRQARGVSNGSRDYRAQVAPAQSTVPAIREVAFGLQHGTAADVFYLRGTQAQVDELYMDDLRKIHCDASVCPMDDALCWGTGSELLGDVLGYLERPLRNVWPNGCHQITGRAQ